MLGSLQSVPVSPVLGRPALDTAILRYPHQCWAEGNDPPWTCWQRSFSCCPGQAVPVGGGGCASTAHSQSGWEPLPSHARRNEQIHVEETRPGPSQHPQGFISEGPRGPRAPRSEAEPGQAARVVPRARLFLLHSLQPQWIFPGLRCAVEPAAPVPVPLPRPAPASLVGHGGAALPTLSRGALAPGTPGALLLLPSPLPPPPHVGMEAVTATVGRRSVVILHLQAADGLDGPPAERAGGRDGGDGPAQDAGVAEDVPARVHASGAFKGTQADGAGVPPMGDPGGSRHRRLVPGHLQRCCWDWGPRPLLVGLEVSSAAGRAGWVLLVGLEGWGSTGGARGLLGCWQVRASGVPLAGPDGSGAAHRTRRLGCCPQDSTSRLPLAACDTGMCCCPPQVMSRGDCDSLVTSQVSGRGGRTQELLQPQRWTL